MRFSDLLPRLLKIQESEGYLPPSRLLELAREIEVPIALINETATFYSFFRMIKRGKYVIRLCNSPSCYLNDCESVVEIFESLLGISVGEVTKDGKFSLERTSCIGCCDGAPAALINDYLYTNLTRERVREVLAKCK